MNYVIHGKIESYPKRSSLIAPFQPELVEELYKYIPKTFEVQLTYENVLVRIPQKLKGIPEIFPMITNNRTSYDNNGDLLQVDIMETILKIYQVVNPILMVVSMIAYIILMIQFFQKKCRFQNYKKVILLNGLLCLYLVRIMTVAYVAATEYETAVDKCQYLANAYPIQSIFTVLAIAFCLEKIQKKIKS